MNTAIRFDFRKNVAPETRLPAGHRAKVIPFPGAEPLPVSPPSLAVTQERPECASKLKSQEKAMKAKIHIALGKLQARLEGFNDDAYRFALQEHWGVDTCAKMNVHQLDEVLHWLAELGFQSNRPFYVRCDHRRWGAADLIEKINALLAEKRSEEGGRFLGMEYAEGILKQQTKGEVDSVYKASPKQLRAVIAALDKDASRKGRRRR